MRASRLIFERLRKRGLTYSYIALLPALRHPPSLTGLLSAPKPHKAGAYVHNSSHLYLFELGDLVFAEAYLIMVFGPSQTSSSCVLLSDTSITSIFLARNVTISKQPTLYQLYAAASTQQLFQPHYISLSRKSSVVQSVPY